LRSLSKKRSIAAAKSAAELLDSLTPPPALAAAYHVTKIDDNEGNGDGDGDGDGDGYFYTVENGSDYPEVMGSEKSFYPYLLLAPRVKHSNREQMWEKFCGKFVIAGMWIMNQKAETPFVFPGEREYAAGFANTFLQWGILNPRAQVKIYYDAALVQEDAVERTQGILKELGSAILRHQIQFINLRSLPNGRFWRLILNPLLPIYYRADAARFAVAFQETSDDHEKVFVYKDYRGSACKLSDILPPVSNLRAIGLSLVRPADNFSSTPYENGLFAQMYHPYMQEICQEWCTKIMTDARMILIKLAYASSDSDLFKISYDSAGIVWESYRELFLVFLSKQPSVIEGAGGSPLSPMQLKQLKKNPMAFLKENRYWGEVLCQAYNEVMRLGTIDATKKVSPLTRKQYITIGFGNDPAFYVRWTGIIRPESSEL
tara:strand:- start:4497 stop:5786 length:1290 start_codon:yes stop_codon:yes gene_type:complete